MQQFNRHAAGVAMVAAGLFLALTPARGARVEQDGLVADGVDPAPAALGAAWLRYQQARGLRLLDWLADGSLLIASAGGGQAYRLGGPLAALESLSTPGQEIADASAHPFDARLIVVRTLGADGHAQLFSQRTGDHTAQALADAGARDDAPLWAHDGRRLAFASDRRNGSDFDVYVVENGSAAGARLVVGGGGRWRVLDWSRDDRALLLRREMGPHDARLFVADIATASLTAIDAPAADARAASQPPRLRLPAARFTPDGRAVLYLREGGAEGYVRLKVMSLDGSPPRELTPVLEHDVERFDVSSDGRFIAYTWEEAGLSRLGIIDQRNRVDLVPPAELPPGVVNALRFERAGTRLALAIETANAPPDIYVVDLATLGCARWTQSAAGSTAAAQPAPARQFRFRTWDRSGERQRELGGFLYSPPRDGPHPVLVLLHDGPEAQFRPGFDAWLQFVVNELGIAVVAPNLRGSGGAGHSFAALDDGLLREDAIRDIGSLLVWIGLQPGIDATRIAVMGRGYGGFQALAALAQYGDRLRAAVAIDPPADLLAVADAAAAAGDAAEFGSSSDERQRALLQRMSPLGFAGSILRPVLLAHFDGTVTGRLSDAEQILWRMRVSGRDAAYVAVDPARCGQACGAARSASWAAIGAYLQAALGGQP
jgi:pimeloyl-ACP methyl ester carboxylesterase